MSRSVVSRVTWASWSVTRQVRLEPWSWGLGVRVSSEELRVSGSISSRASPAQENRKGCRPAQTSDRLQVSCVGRPASRGSTNWMSGFSVGAEEETEADAWTQGCGDPEGDPQRDQCLTAAAQPRSWLSPEPKTPRPGAARAPVPCSCSDRGVSTCRVLSWAPSHLSPANSASYQRKYISD